MIRRATVVYITILVVLAGVFFYLRYREKPATDILITPVPTEQITYLFTAGDGVPTSIRIQSKTGETVELAHDAENAWVLTQPIEAKADQGSSEAAATQITTMRVLNKIPELDPAIAGLETPEYMLTVRFSDGGERTVHIGVITPSESGYYVRAPSDGEVLVVTRSAVDSLLSLLSMPPYLETPTPNP